MHHELTVVDLSHHNVLIREGAVESGVVGVIHKATEGNTLIDGNYADRRVIAKNLGLKWASYHFLRPGDIEQQMDFYIDVAAPERGSRVVIDYEDEDLTLNDLRAAISAIEFLDPSLQITVYGGHLLKEQLGDDYDVLLATTSLWIAHYTEDSAPKWPQGTWPMWTLWQYSDGQSGGDPKYIEGIDGVFDCNSFNGSAENCALWFGPVGGDGEPVEPSKQVIVDIVTPEGVDVIVNVRGAEEGDFASTL